MRDLNSTTEWSDTLTFRVQYQSIRPGPNIQQTTPEPPAAQSVSDDQSSGDCHVMRLSPSSMSTLRSIPSTSPILLLTPVILPQTAHKASAKDSTKARTIDPFEAFGRELSKLHSRLRHVPYRPDVGITDTHAAFIEQSAATIVVTCETQDSDEDSLANQRLFADAVVAKRDEFFLAKRDELRDDDDDLPLMLVRFGPNAMKVCEEEYENVLHAPALTTRACIKATRLIFNSETRPSRRLV